MSEISGKAKTNSKAIRAANIWRVVASPYLISVLFFFVICFLSASTIKTMGIIIAVALLLTALILFERLRDRLTLPVLALAAYVLMDGISTFYAIAGKFALYEFLKVFCAFGLALILLAVAPGDREKSTRWIATVLECAVAIACVVSVDLIATRKISDLALNVLAGNMSGYSNLSGLYDKGRLASIFDNSNIFGGFSGLGILLSLGLVRSSENKWEKGVHSALLYIILLSFALGNSLGSILSLACALLLFVVFERPEKRAGTMALMLGAVILVMFASSRVSPNLYVDWEVPDPKPLVYLFGGALVLGALVALLGETKKIRLHLSDKMLALVTLGIVFLSGVYALVAWNWTGSISLGEGESVRRAKHLAEGEYAFTVEADAPVQILVSSEERVGAQMLPSTLYDSNDHEAGEDAVFVVPEGSDIVYFTFSANEPVRIEFSSLEGAGKTVKIPLDYKILPDFLANRLQGILYAGTGIARFAHFEDGIKLFHRSPIYGLGMGAFENAVLSVQSVLDYTTKYAHNHYIQTMLETGLIGLFLYVGLFAVSFACVIRSRKSGTPSFMLPALGAALAFMAIHAMVEVVFSAYPYLPIAYTTFAMVGLCCCEVKKNRKTVRVVALSAICVFFAVFAILILSNIRARQLAMREMTFQALEQAAKMDKFEWADYLLTYVDQSTGPEADEEVRTKAAVYAERLAEVESNSIAIILAQYYFRIGDIDRAFKMVEQYVEYVPAANSTWEEAYRLLSQYDDGSEEFKNEALRLAELMNAWNETHVGHVDVGGEAGEYLAGYQQ